VAADARSVTRPLGTALGELLDGIATCVVWLDADGAVLHLNEPAEDLFGISRNQPPAVPSATCSRPMPSSTA